MSMFEKKKGNVHVKNKLALSQKTCRTPILHFELLKPFYTSTFFRFEKKEKLKPFYTSTLFRFEKKEKKANGGEE